MDDLVIVGAGPAGMTAAVYAARKGMNPLVLSADVGGQANWSSEIENYMGFTDIRGSELMNRFEEHMKAQRLRLAETRVKSVTRQGEGFAVEGEDGKSYRARAVIVATGKIPRMLNVPGEAAFRGKGVSYCSTCDGPLFRGARVAVVGGGNSALQACNDLLPIAAEVHLISNTPLTADDAVKGKVLGREKLQVYENCSVQSIEGDRLVTRVVFSGAGGRREIPVEGVFVEIGLNPNSSVVPENITRNELGEIKVDCFCRTNMPGLFAAGDVTNAPGKQIIIAAGEGAKAALQAFEYIAFDDRKNGL